MSSKTDKRAKEILRLLLRHGKTSVDDLTSVLGTSPASIRRDLTRLEEQGLVHRTHGGAMLATAGQTVYEPFRLDASFQVREDRFTAEKLRIARAAAALVQESETIGIAAGTTTTLVARQLLHRKGLHVITNAANIGLELGSSPRLQTMLTGGYLRWSGAFSLVGHPASSNACKAPVSQQFAPKRSRSAVQTCHICGPDSRSKMPCGGPCVFRMCVFLGMVA